MIYSLKGILTVSEPSLAVVECGGVGYACQISLTTARKLPPVGKEVFLRTYLNIREDAADLFGFYDQKELASFKMLTSVNGVGPRVALSILSEFDPDKLAVNIASSDAKSLTAASGVGIKIAQRIVLELKDKISSGDISFSSDASVSSAGNFGEAIGALTALGYTQTEASAALKGANPNASVEDLIKIGLRYFSGKRG
ncbi:MAG: Holliday junction branch migration protein RuvA [Oscillospiraceae bacterium]|nr:Holliday junction branch migration protein RuvA [Oscillospiraceae bacterium]